MLLTNKSIRLLPDEKSDDQNTVVSLAISKVAYGLTQHECCIKKSYASKNTKQSEITRSIDLLEFNKRSYKI